MSFGMDDFQIVDAGHGFGPTKQVLKIDDRIIYELDKGVLKISMPPELVQKLNERFHEDLKSDQGLVFSLPVPPCFHMVELKGVIKFESIESPDDNYVYTEEK